MNRHLEKIVWHILFFGGILAAGLWYQRIVECAILFVVTHAIRYSFPTTYHNKLSNRTCLVISLAVAWLVMPHVLPLQFSIFSSLLVGIGIGWYAYHYQRKNDRLEELEALIMLLQQQARREQRSVYEMDEEELRKFAFSKGLSEVIIDTLVLRLIKHYRWIDVIKERGYTKEGVRYHKEQIRQHIDKDI